MFGCQINGQFDPSEVELAIGSKNCLQRRRPVGADRGERIGHGSRHGFADQCDQEAIKLTTRSLSGCVVMAAMLGIHPMRLRSEWAPDRSPDCRAVESLPGGRCEGPPKDPDDLVGRGGDRRMIDVHAL
jgi:hypothetical protein